MSVYECIKGYGDIIALSSLVAFYDIILNIQQVSLVVLRPPEYEGVFYIVVKVLEDIYFTSKYMTINTATHTHTAHCLSRVRSLLRNRIIRSMFLCYCLLYYSPVFCIVSLMLMGNIYASNITYITLDGHLDVEKYRLFYFITTFALYILIICCNSTIVYIIWTQQTLHEPMYVFIAALLVNAILLSTTFYPKLLIDFLSEKQIISYPACLFQFQIFYSLGGAEFLLLAAMAYDRYVSICKPLQYPNIMTKTTIGVFLLVAWVLPAAQVAVRAGLSAKKKLCSFTFKGIYCNNSMYNLQCVVSRVQIMHDMVIFLNIAFLPVFFILFTYTKILIICYHSGKEVRKKAAQTCLPHLIVLTNYSCLCAFNVINVHLESFFPKSVRLMMSLQIFIYHPLFNPILYGLKMNEISKHLKALFFPTKKI